MMRTERSRARQAPRRHGVGAASGRAALGAFIESRGLKHSRQRDLIADAFFANGGHVSVDELVLEARQADPRISVATVYRTVKLLADSGLAVPRQFGGGQTRYEPTAGRPHHDHLICTACGEILEFSNPRIEALQAAVARQHGFDVETHKLELYGRCARCRRNVGANAGAERAP